jgi:DMSO reductase anchor subunit
LESSFESISTKLVVSLLAISSIVSLFNSQVIYRMSQNYTNIFKSTQKKSYLTSTLHVLRRFLVSTYSLVLPLSFGV